MLIKNNKKKLILVFFVFLGVFLVSAVFGLQKYGLELSKKPKQPKVELKQETMQAGYGDRTVQAGDYILINYIGALQDGTMIDSNLSRTEPYGTYVGKGTQISGWEQGLIGMKVGEKRKLTVPPELGYGSEGTDKVPKNATLVYEIELLDIK